MREFTNRTELLTLMRKCEKPTLMILQQYIVIDYMHSFRAFVISLKAFFFSQMVLCQLYKAS